MARRSDERFDPAALNSDRAEKLRRNELGRRARSRGLELRHSAYGYSLVDGARNRVDDRNDLSLDEVAAALDVT